MPTLQRIAPFLTPYFRLGFMALASAVLATQLAGCVSTAVFLATKYGDKLPVACSGLTSVERAIASHCGGYKAGELIAKDVNQTAISVCPLTNFARNPALWHGLPELLAKGANPERCAKAPLLAMAEVQSCPAFSKMAPATLEAVRWLAIADAASINGPVLYMLSCPEAVTAGLSSVVTQWIAQGQLQPNQISFSALSRIHPSGLTQPWVTDLLAAGHQPLRAVQDDATGFENALAQGDVVALGWWTQQVPSLVHRAPPRGYGFVPWLPLARTMSPGFAANDAARMRSAEMLMQRGASLNASLPHDRGQSVGDYARSAQPQLWTPLQAAWQRAQADRQALALNMADSLEPNESIVRTDVRSRPTVIQAQ